MAQVVFLEGTAPITPESGYVTLYAKTDGAIYSKDDAGAETKVTGGGDALVANPLSQFAATTSLQLLGVISDETGTGALVFANSPTLVAPALGTPSSGVATNLTGTAAGLTSGNVTTNANLTGDVTSVGNASTLATVATAGVTGSSTAIPVITINVKGLTTSITTVAVIAPAGTLSGSTLASGVTASSLTSVGTLASLTTSGDVVVGGDLTVNGTTTTLNVTNLDVEDLNITVALGAASAAAANGAGLTVAGPATPATLTYSSADDRWNLNKNLNVTTIYGALFGNATTSTTAGATNALKSATTTVDVSSAAAPTIGQVLTATSGTAAIWKDVGGYFNSTLMSFPTGDYGIGEEYIMEGSIQDAFGVALVASFSCMDPQGNMITADDLGVLT